MFGLIHAVGDGAVPGGAAVGFRIGEDILDVLVLEQRPPEEVAARDRATLAHLVVGATLIAEDGIILWIPVGSWFVAHGPTLCVVGKCRLD